MRNLVRPLAFHTFKGLSLIALALAAAPLAAKDIVELDAQGHSFSPGPTDPSLHVGGSSLLDLVGNFVGARDQFSSLSSFPHNDAQIKAMGVTDAIHINVDQSGVTVVTARVRTIAGLDRTFTGTSRDDVEAQIKDFLKKEGAGELANLLNYLNSHTPLSVNAGNPNSSAALTAQSSFDQYGFTEGHTNEEAEEGTEPAYELALRGDVGLIESKGYHAQSYSIPIAFSVYEAERWAVRAQIPLNYTEIEGATIFRGGLNLAVPVMVIGSTKDNKSPWYWQLTPSGGSQVTTSFDLISGGILNNVALTSALEYNFGRRWHNITISMGNQITALESMKLTIGDYSFDPNVSAQILKNGLKVSVPFARRWLVDAYFIDTRFFGDAAYSDGYETVGAAIGYRRAKGAFFKVGTYANIGKDYASVNFHFGTGWRF
jgi:hypothetical protein